MGVKQKIKLGDLIEVSYSKNKCEIKQKDNIVFHGINSSHLPKKSTILVPKEPDMTFYKRYLEYLKKPKIHLGPFEIAGPINPNYDLHFCFDIDELKKSHPEIKFMNHYIWMILSLYNTNDRKKLENNLFIPKYDNKKICEVIVDSLDISKAKAILYYSLKQEKMLQQFNVKKYYAKNIRDAINY